MMRTTSSMFTSGMQTSHLSAKFAVLKTKLTTCVIRGDPLRKHLEGGVLVAPANTFSMERRADREKAQHSVRRHDKWAHSRGTVASVLVERMRALLKPRGQPTARAESRLPSETAKREPSGAFKCLVSTERFHRRQYPHGRPDVDRRGSYVNIPKVNDEN